MNKVILIGNVTRKPELRAAGSKGTPVCTFTVAVNNRGKDKESTDFFRVTAWSKLAELCNQYLDKGRKVCVIGSVGISEYTGKDGKNHASLEVTASEVEFLSAREPVDEAVIPKGFVPVEADDLPF